MDSGALLADWKTGNPPDHGYYLASWGVGESRTVSELWYNPTNGWWTSRGYLQYYDGQRNWGHQLVPNVYAWKPMPAPAPLANADDELRAKRK